MITATLRAAPGGAWRALRLSGHAGAGVKGSDPVCAAVSLLADATLFTMSSVYGIEPELTRDAGALALTLPGELAARQQAAAQVLLENMRSGLALLAGRYPDNITLTIEED